jgi:hypothetical protein
VRILQQRAAAGIQACEWPRMSHHITNDPGNDHGNRTERRRRFTPADGSPRIMIRVIRQNTTYHRQVDCRQGELRRSRGLTHPCFPEMTQPS